MRTSLPIYGRILIVGILLVAILFCFYSTTYAQSANVDAGANAMCQSSWTAFYTACMAKQPPPPPSVCQQQANAKNLAVACSGSGCSGKCNYPMGGGGFVVVCGGLQCNGQPEQASDAGAQKAMDMAKSLMDALKGAAGGGGGAPPGGGAPTGGSIPSFPPPPPFDPTAGSQYNPQSFDNPNLDYASYTTGAGASSTYGSGSVTGAGVNNYGSNNALKAAFGETTVKSVGQVGETATSKAEAILAAVLGREAGGVPANKEYGQLESGDQVHSGQQLDGTETGDADFGPPGVEGSGSGGGDGKGPRGSIKLSDSGVFGFLGRLFGFGGQGEADMAFFEKLCNARPWQSSLITRVFSASFFDSLCVQYGFTTGSFGGPDRFSSYFNQQPGRALLVCAPQKVKITEYAAVQWDCDGSQSSSAGFETKGSSSGITALQPADTGIYMLRCANGGFAQCTIEVQRPRVQIVAHPERVPLGTRTRIFWTSEDSVECVVEGPGLKEKGLRGAATTASILNQTTFSVICRSEEGFEVSDSVVVEPGV